MATGTYNCVFCPAVFDDNNAFWDHMSAGTCGGESVNTPLSPPQLKDTAPQQSRNSADFQLQPRFSPSQFPQQAQLAAVCRPKCSVSTVSPSPSVQFQPTQQSSVPHSTPVSLIEYDFTKKSKDVPVFYLSSSESQVPYISSLSPSVNIPPSFYPSNPPLSLQPQSTMPTKVASQNSLNESNNSLGSKPRKLKCTLCSVSFTDRSSMMNHVRTPEHEANIKAKGPQVSVIPPPAVNVSSPQPVFDVHTSYPAQSSLPMELPKPEPSSLAPTQIMNTEELESTIRRICREELKLVLRKELQNLLSPVLQDPLVLPSSTSSTGNSSSTDATFRASPAVATNSMSGSGDGNIVEMIGASMHCLVCDVNMSSMANLEAHLVGKKHKSGLSKLANQALH